MSGLGYFPYRIDLLLLILILFGYYILNYYNIAYTIFSVQYIQFNLFTLIK